MSVYPFVNGENGHDAGLDDSHWVSLGQTLKKIHAAKLSPKLTAQIPRESFSIEWSQKVPEHLKEIDGTDYADTVSMGLAKLLMDKRSIVEDILQQTDRLRHIVTGQKQHLVLCHADIHAWNVLIEPNGSFCIVDWDTIILAPKEPDLMFVASGLFGKSRTPEREEQLFYQGYGDMQLADPILLAYYRYARILQDIADYCDGILLTESGEDRAEGLRQLTTQFEPGGVVDMALRSEEFLPIQLKRHS